MGHRVSTPLIEDGTSPPATPIYQRRQWHDGCFYPKSSQSSRSSPIGNSSNIATLSSSSITSSRTLTMAILLCAATSSHFSGVTTASPTSPPPPCGNHRSPSCYAFASNRLDCRSTHRRPNPSSLGPLVSSRSPEAEPHSPEYRNGSSSPLLSRTEPDLSNTSARSPLFFSPSHRTRRPPRRAITPLHLTTTLSSSSTACHSSSFPLHTFSPDDTVHDHQEPPSSTTEEYPNRYPNGRLRRLVRRREQRRSSKQGQISSAAQIHYDDALLTRILKGRKSKSARWRKRTRHAAACLGFRLLEDNSQPRRLQPPTPQQKTPPTPKPSTTLPSPYQPHLTPAQHQQKMRWAARYTSLSTLRSTFGTNRNKFWGDFDLPTTRRIYNTLLPRALLGLYEMGLWSPDDLDNLAPLAYEARVAAKMYARERCVVPGRVVAMLYDGWRSWRKCGTWSVEGMSWDQVWYKYEAQILKEMMMDDAYPEGELFETGEETEEVTTQICLRILKRSCITNKRINQLLMGDGEDVEMEEDCGKRSKRRRNAERYLGVIATKLDRDMQELMEANEKHLWV